ncbi:hypothetical protein KAU45_09980 [bacterium]|nr:hypothetical protein [bacterium]
MDRVGDDLTRAQLWALELYQRALRKIDRRLGELPEEESAFRRRAEEVEERLGALEEELKAKQLEQKRLETEVDDIKERRTRHQRQLLSAKDNREYKTLLEEIELENRRQTELEDRILELMENLEGLVPRVKKTRTEKEDEVTGIEKALAALSAEGEKLEGRRARLEKGRDTLVGRLDATGRRIFNKLVAQRHICALMDGGICSSCRVEVPTQAISEARAGELRSCESCSAILFTEEQASLARTMARNRGFLPDEVEG